MEISTLKKSLVFLMFSCQLLADELPASLRYNIEEGNVKTVRIQLRSIWDPQVRHQAYLYAVEQHQVAIAEILYRLGAHEPVSATGPLMTLDAALGRLARTDLGAYHRIVRPAALPPREAAPPPPPPPAAPPRIELLDDDGGDGEALEELQPSPHDTAVALANAFVATVIAAEKFK